MLEEYHVLPCSSLSVNLLSRWFLAELIFSTLKMEEICSSETLVDTQRTTLRCIPGDGTLHNHRCENLKSYSGNACFHLVQKTFVFASAIQKRKDLYIKTHSFACSLYGCETVSL
jgi:hypothetical protein